MHPKQIAGIRRIGINRMHLSLDLRARGHRVGQLGNFRQPDPCLPEMRYGALINVSINDVAFQFDWHIIFSPQAFTCHASVDFDCYYTKGSNP